MIAAFAANPTVIAEIVERSEGPIRRGGDHETKVKSNGCRQFRPIFEHMIFSHLASPAEALNETASGWRGFAQAENRYPPRITSGAGFFGITL